MSKTQSWARHPILIGRILTAVTVIWFDFAFGQETQRVFPAEMKGHIIKFVEAIEGSDGKNGKGLIDSVYSHSSLFNPMRSLALSGNFFKSQRTLSNDMSVALSLIDFGQFPERVTNEVRTTDLAIVFSHGYNLVYSILQSDKLDQDQKARAVGTILGTLARLNFALMRHRHDDKSPDGKAGFFKTIQRASLEIVRDFLHLILIHRNIEAATREKFIRKVSEFSQNKENELLPLVHGLQSTKVEEYFFGQTFYKVSRAVNIRGENDSAQRLVRVFYLFSAVALAVYTPINYFETDHYLSMMNSAIVNFTALSLGWFLKGWTSSRKSTREWVKYLLRLREQAPDDLEELIENNLAEDTKNEKVGQRYHKGQISRGLRWEFAFRRWIGLEKDPVVDSLIGPKAGPVSKGSPASSKRDLNIFCFQI